MTVYAITDTKKGEQGLRLLIFKLGPEQLLVTPSWNDSFIGTKVLGTFAPEERKFHRSERERLHNLNSHKNL